MKKLAIIAITFLIGTMSLFAFEKEPEVTTSEIRNQLMEILAKSDHSFENDFEVKLYFTFTTDGRIVLEKIDPMDYKIKKYFRDNLNLKTFKKPGLQNVKYDITIILKPA